MLMYEYFIAVYSEKENVFGKANCLPSTLS